MRTMGLSYEKVGEALGVHPITVRNWEKQGLPKLATLAFKYVFLRGSFEQRRPFWYRGGRKGE